MLQNTNDGSHTILSEQFGVTYHSIHGAIQETKHVFIDAGFLHKILQGKEKEPIAILDIGLGTGLNAFMTYLEADKRQISTNYTGIEAYPISSETASLLNYAALLAVPAENAVLQKMHQCEWEVSLRISDHFSFTKQKKTFQEIGSQEEYDIIYFDAFGPGAQAELWEAEVLSKMYNALKPDGILVTYCAKGVVKRTLKSLGFTVESIPGPPGKREMTRSRRTVVNH